MGRIGSRGGRKPCRRAAESGGGNGQSPIARHHPATRAGWFATGACLVLVFVGQSLSGPPIAWSQAQSKYETDLEAFFQELDRTYPFFDLKGIRNDWEAVEVRLLIEVRTCASDEGFLEILIEAIRCLRDAHVGPRGFIAQLPPRPPKYYPGISFLPATNNRVVVLYPPPVLDADVQTGTVVTKIDGQDARTYLEERAEAAWEEGGFFSSPQRARLYEYRIPLCGEKQGEKHTLTVIVDGQERVIELASTVEAHGWPHTFNLPDDRTHAGSASFTKLPSGIGYIYLRRVDGSTTPAIQKATETYRDVKGWIIDLRGNGGGGYGTDLHDQLKTLPRPVACLIDAGCMSAGETLARDIVNLCDARLFGTKTAGSSSSKRVWAFPSGIGSMLLPRRSRWGIGGRPIEFNGIDPHEVVEAVPEELQQGLNSAIRRAEEYLLGERR